MSAAEFDDARLEDPQLVNDAHLRALAETGARVRKACLGEPRGTLERAERPRGVLALGAEARLVRAVLEPVCPVPFVAWPGPALPAWVGPLDLVVVLGGRDAPAWEIACAYEAARRGATLIVAAPEASQLAAAGAAATTTLIPMDDGDPMAAAVAVLELLGLLELGPSVNPGHVADAADLVASASAPGRELGSNPAKDLALAMADKLPLVWGGTTLAGRASRRIAEALRRASGRPALAADAEELETILRAVTPRDLFGDPSDVGGEMDPMLLMLDAHKVVERLSEVPRRLAALAEAAGVRVCHIGSGESSLASSDVESYVTLLQHGRYAAAYLRVGLSS